MLLCRFQNGSFGFGEHVFAVPQKNENAIIHMGSLYFTVHKAIFRGMGIRNRDQGGEIAETVRRPLNADLFNGGVSVPPADDDFSV